MTAVPQVTELVVRRVPGGYRDRYRAYTVMVDGVEAGRLRRGEETAVPVAPGWHEVQLTIGFTGSPGLVVEVQPGARVVVVATPGKPASALSDLLTSKAWVSLALESTTPT